MSDDRVEIDVEEVRRTVFAMLVKDADDTEHWLPLSQVVTLEENFHGSILNLKISIPEWLAIKEGLV